TFQRRSYSCHSCRARATMLTYRLCAGPYAARIVRVSPPELAREFPGPQESRSRTLAPLSARWRADQPPNAPAPTTITKGRDEGESLGEPRRQVAPIKADSFRKLRRDLVILSSRRNAGILLSSRSLVETGIFGVYRSNPYLTRIREGLPVIH